MYAATWWRSIGVSKGDEMPRIWFCLLLVLLPLPFTSSSHLEDTPHTKSQNCKNQSQIAAHWPYPHLPILSPSVLLLILRLPGSIWEVSTTLPRKRHWPLGALRGSASFKPSTKLLTRDGCNLLRSWSNRMAWYWNDVFIQMYTAAYLCEKILQSFVQPECVWERKKPIRGLSCRIFREILEPWHLSQLFFCERNKSKMRVLMLLVVSLPYIYTEYS